MFYKYKIVPATIPSRCTLKVVAAAEGGKQSLWARDITMESRSATKYAIRWIIKSKTPDDHERGKTFWSIV